MTMSTKLEAVAKIAKRYSSAQLKELCVNCGVSQTGTKVTLAERLVSADRSGRIPSRLYSIDMGVKNLALCELEFPSTVTATVRQLRLVELPNTTESFQQPQFARVALQLMSSLGELPPVVLIEQQRMRSQGLSNVPEWISRVNLLEAMLHALIQAQIANRQCDAATQVFAIPPAKVMQYWVRSEAQESNNSNRRYRLTKQAKVDVVDSWLKSGNAPFVLGDGIETGLRASKKKDDLYDALLQGLAWHRWEINKQRFDQAIVNGDFDVGVGVGAAMLTNAA